VRITQSQLSVKQSRFIAKLVHFVNDLERVGDHCDRLARLARRKYEDKHTFSKYANKEVDNIFKLAIRFSNLTIKVLRGGGQKVAEKSFEIEHKINAFTKEYRENHVKRLGKGICKCEPGLVFTDILIHIEKIGDHLFNITGRITKE